MPSWYVEVRRNIVQGCEVEADSAEEAVELVRTGSDAFDYDVVYHKQNEFEVIEVSENDDDWWSDEEVDEDEF